MSTTLQCKFCGGNFKVPNWRASKARFCSPKCRDEENAKRYSEARVTKECRACGKAFDVPRSHESRRVCCSEKCANASYQFNSPTGEKHYAWKGGKTGHADGYRYLLVRGHPFGTINANGYVFEHRLVMEEMMRQAVPDHPFLIDIDGQKYLRPEIAVHHINLAKNDNRPSNLLACTAAAHRDIHNGNAPMQGEVWPEIEGLEAYEPRRVACKCQVCGAEFIKKRCDVKRGNGRFYCSRTCYDNRSKTPLSITIKQSP